MLKGVGPLVFFYFLARSMLRVGKSLLCLLYIKKQISAVVFISRMTSSCAKALERVSRICIQVLLSNIYVGADYVIDLYITLPRMYL